MADFATITAAVDAMPYEQQRRLAAHLRDKGLAALDHPDTDTPFTTAWQRFQYMRQL